MISIELISNQSSPADSFVVTRPSELIPGENLSEPESPTCCFYIDRLVQEIDSPEVKGIVRTVFQDLLRLLECVSLIEDYLPFAFAV